jgi:predicted nucleic acid-binding protein
LILLDAYALVAFIGEGPAAGEVEALLREREVGIPLVNLSEAIDVTQRVFSVRPEELREVVEPLLGDEVRLVAHGEDHAWRAAELRLHYYDRRRRALSLADCLLLAAAAPGDEIATADPPVAEVTVAEEIGLIALPDSFGRRP